MKIAGIEFLINEEARAADVVDADGARTYANLIEAWGAFIHKVDAIGRKRLGDRLEEWGFDRYTGEKRSPTQRPVPAASTPATRTSCENCQMGGTCLARGSLGSCVNGIPIDPGKEEE